MCLTIEELSKYHNYEVLIEILTEEIKHLEHCSMGLIASYNSQGGGSGNTKDDVVSRQASMLIAQKESLKMLRIHAMQERGKIFYYITNTVALDDSQVSKMMYQRFIKRKSWNGVAMSVGGGNTADSCRKAVFRYCKR